MARYFDVHPDNPQPRAIAAVVDLLHAGGLIAYPTGKGSGAITSFAQADGFLRIDALADLNTTSFVAAQFVPERAIAGPSCFYRADIRDGAGVIAVPGLAPDAEPDGVSSSDSF